MLQRMLRTHCVASRCAYSFHVEALQSKRIQFSVGRNRNLLVAVHVIGDGIEADSASRLKVQLRLASLCIQGVKISFVRTGENQVPSCR
jgi:hypothetical protein